MIWLVIAVLIVIGLLFLLLEVLVIPGVGVAGIVGFVLIGIGIWQTYAQYGGPAGHIVLAGTLVLTILLLVLALRSKTWKKIALNSSIDSKVNVIDHGKIKVGDEGRTISRLAPAGKALINGEYYEVRTTGAFFDQDKPIVVVKIDNEKIFVEQKIN